jgi:alpha-1,2-mannosyltransferase
MLTGEGATGPIQAAFVPGAAPAIRLSRGMRRGLVLVSAATFALALGIWVWHVENALRIPLGRLDFSDYYVAARALRLDPHANIYSPAVLKGSRMEGQVPFEYIPYVYPPLLAILLAPLTIFPFPVAASIWLFCNTILWLASMLLVANELRHLLRGTLIADGAVAGTAGMGGPFQAGLWARLLADPSPLVALATAGMLFFASRPAAQTFALGQVDFLVLLPLAIVPWLTRHRHERAVGAAIGLAAMLKITPLVLLGYLVLRRRWTALAAALATLALLAAVSVAVVGPEVFFVNQINILPLGASILSFHNNEAFLVPVASAITDAVPTLAPAVRVAEYAILAALVSAVGWALWRTRRVGRVSMAEAGAIGELPAYAAALCLVVLLAPVAWIHHYIWLVLAIALVLGLAARTTLTGWGGIPLRWAVLLLASAVVAAVLVNMPLPYGWDSLPNSQTPVLFGVPLRACFQELRPIGGLLVVATALFFLFHFLKQSTVSATKTRASS